MARKVIETFVSDLSGEEIQEEDAWTMTLAGADGKGSTFHLDLSSAEAEAFTSKGIERKRRGRRPGSRNKPKDA